MKNLLFGKLGEVRSALFAVGQGDLLILKWTKQDLQPIGIDRIYMGAGNDDQLAGCGLNPEVERTPEGEFVGTDSNYPRAEGFSNGNSPIGRARVDEDDLHIFYRLVSDSLQQTPNMFFFVIRTDDNGTVHENLCNLSHNSSHGKRGPWHR